MINTRFWSDTYVANLDSLEKLLFLYFITNQYTNICGIYEIPIKQIALDTGIDRENLEKVLLPRFRKARKIYYFNGWVYIKNFLKHQKASGNVKLGIENGLNDVPSEIMAQIRALEDTPTYDLDTASNLNPNPNPNLNISIVIRDYWNTFLIPSVSGYRNLLAKKLLPECRKITPDIEKALTKILNGYSEEDVKNSIKNYVADILNRNPDNDYARHRFSFYEFLKQSNGFVKFINK